MKKKMKVEYSKEVLKKLDEVSDKDYAILTAGIKKVVKSIEKGKPIGKLMNLVKCDIKLLCGRCGSKNVDWTLDKNSKEVYFACYDCHESCWIKKSN